LLGILLLWTLWPSIARGHTTWISWRDFHRPKFITLLLASLLPLLLVFTIATFPGEWLESNLPSLPLVPTKWPTLGESTSLLLSEEEGRGRFWPTVSVLGFRSTISTLVHSMEWSSPHDLLVAGDVDLVARRPTSLGSNRLVLPGIDVIDHAKFDSEEKIEAL